MTSRSRWIYAVSFLLAAAGFLLPFWPLTIVGVLIAAFSGRWFFAICVALLVDLAWGRPTGFLQILFFPLTALALVAALARIFGERYFINKNLPDHL